MTQAALGAWIGELMMGKRLGKRALACGAFLGILPELLENALSPFLDTARELATDQALAHSLPTILLGTWAIAHGLAALWKREKVSKVEAAKFVLAVWAAHVLVDCFSTAGAAILWPFEVKRFTFNLLHQPDFLFSAPLVVTALWLAFLKTPVVKKSRAKKQPPLSKQKKLAHWCFGLTVGYVLLASGMKFITSAGFDADLKRRGTVHQRRMESPASFNILLWRSVVDRGDELWVGYRTVFESQQTPVRWTIYPKNRESLAEVAALPETKTLTTITDGYWLARPNIKGAWLGDLRFPETRIWGSKKDAVDSRLAISWIIDAGRKNNRLQVIYPTQNHANQLSRMWKRIIGDRTAWEANPRLAGAVGNLPEFLPVAE